MERDNKGKKKSLKESDTCEKMWKTVLKES